ncbi:MAG: T9SS type A sorting domain-containing protein [Saprospiraceae bacterium]|nr:T9SS type A sorting domain-containing protein [Saprospiraceae bacterium]
MKKVMIKCALTVCFCIGMLSWVMANPNLPAVEIVEAKFEKKISFEARSVQGKATVSLLDDNQVSLYAQTWKDQASIGKVFDLDALPSGKYVLFFETETNEIIQPFQIEGGRVKLKENDRVIRHVPIVRKAGEYINLSWLNDETTNVQIAIQDESGANVLEEKLKGVLKVARRYDISRLESGIYLVKVKTKAKTYYREISW